MTHTARRPTRRPLSRERVLEAAVRLADTSGLDAVSMRRLGTDLGVEAMSLYHHVSGKEALLDAMVEHVGAELNAEIAAHDAAGAPDPVTDWRAALRARALAARVVMLRHPWMPSVLQSRTAMSLEVVRYFDGVVAILMAGGFGHDLTHHALHALGSRVIGFTQELFDPGGGEDTSEEVLAQMADARPEPHGDAGRRRAHRRAGPDARAGATTRPSSSSGSTSPSTVSSAAARPGLDPHAT